MGADALLPAEIVAALERGATVVTGNQRAARTLRLRFDRLQKVQGRRSWQPPRVVAWDAWLGGWWSRLITDGRVQWIVLNRSQELAVWRGILDDDTQRQSLRGVESLAEMAAEAWSLLCRYRGLDRLRELGVSTDTKAFQRWALGFERRCRDEGWTTQAGVVGLLREGVAAGEFEPVERELLLVGFDGLTPAQEGLLETLQESGVSVDTFQLGASAEDRALVTAGDTQEELRACALWVREILRERPEAQIAVIVPGLQSERAALDRVLREILAPELEEVGAGAPPYEFSVGMPLAEVPMVRVGLDLLGWIEGSLPLERVSALLLSPYFADGRAGAGARAEFDAFKLRRAKLLRPELSLEGLMRLVGPTASLTAVVSALQRMAQVATRRFAKDESLGYAEWADAMREWLEAAAWGAGTSEDSLEFQIRAKWEAALDELATLDFAGPRVAWRSALEAVERIARRTVFAAESREAPVQVMGPLEAAGGMFDAMWFLRAGEMTWPMTAATSSLLPWGLQRELEMPGADAGREMRFARSVSRRVAGSAGTVMFSYAVMAGEETGRQRASAALDELELPAVVAETIVALDEVRERVVAETVEDDVHLPALPDRIIRGGAALLAAQAACGFKAFAEQRLWSTELDVGELGMDAAERGTLVHAVLELFWKSVKTQDELKAMTEAERMEMLEWCIRKETQSVAEASQTAWEVAYVDMERKRLQRLLGEWLQLELARAPFEVKLSEKRLDDVRVGPLRLRVIVDRVDLVDDGGGAEGEQASEPAEMILDYKTGQAEPSQWLTERPDAPQLPLYAILSQAPRLAGVAFAKVRLGDDMHLHGYATQGDLVTKSAKLRDGATLEAQVEEWRRVLTRLAEEFAAGDARVRPKSYPKTCEHCAQRLVCRLDVSGLDAAGLDAAYEDEAENDAEGNDG